MKPLRRVLSLWHGVITRNPPRADLHIILNAVAAKWDISPEMLRERSRRYYALHPRQEFYWRALQAGFSTLVVAPFVNRDHSTVIHGAARHAKRLAEEAAHEDW